MYREGYEELRYFDQNLYLEKKHAKLIKEKRTTTFIYVKNNQKYFTYNDIQIEGVAPYYIVDPIVEVYTPYNQGTDKYAMICSTGALLLNYDAGSLELNAIFNEYGVMDTIASTPSVYRRIDDVIYYTKQELASYNFLAISFFVLDMIVMVFLSINMIENNKRIVATKLWLGYPIASIYGTYLSILMGCTMMSGFIVGLFSKQLTLTMLIAWYYLLLSCYLIICG